MKPEKILISPCPKHKVDGSAWIVIQHRGKKKVYGCGCITKSVGGRK